MAPIWISIAVSGHEATFCIWISRACEAFLVRQSSSTLAGRKRTSVKPSCPTASTNFCVTTISRLNCSRRKRSTSEGTDEAAIANRGPVKPTVKPQVAQTLRSPPRWPTALAKARTSICSSSKHPLSGALPRTVQAAPRSPRTPAAVSLATTSSQAHKDEPRIHTKSPWRLLSLPRLGPMVQPGMTLAFGDTKGAALFAISLNTSGVTD